MAYDFKFPDVGEGITEAEIVKWRVAVGDTVKEDDVLADVETDKAVVEIPAPVSGTILELKFKEKETVHVGDVVAVIGEKGEAPKKEKLEEKVETAPEVKEETKEESKKKGSVAVVGELEDADDIEHGVRQAREELSTVTINKDAPKKASAVEQADKAVGKILAMPKVRQLAKEMGVDMNNVKASGSQGQATETDVRTAAGSGSSEVKKEVKHNRKYDIFGYVDRIPLKGMRKAIAKNMVNSATTIPHVTQIDKADVTELVALRKREKAAAEKKGVKLTYLPFVIKACIAGFKEHPLLNASLQDDGEGGEEIIAKKYYNIGFALDTPDGLMVPVIKGAEKKSILEIASEIVHLAELGKERKINIADMKGGTFTITNYGSIGGLAGTPVINHPESSILGVGKIVEEATVIDGKIQARHMMYLSLSFDHRILDGAEAARFLNKVIHYLEDPDSLLVDM